MINVYVNLYIYIYGHFHYVLITNAKHSEVSNGTTNI